MGFDFQEEREKRGDWRKKGFAAEVPELPADRILLICKWGPYLGTAVAVSGAAVNPNMGSHASAPGAFLLTLFNVRLGWWMGNPRREETWQSSTPPLGLFYLLCQLLGVT